MMVAIPQEKPNSVTESSHVIWPYCSSGNMGWDGIMHGLVSTIRINGEMTTIGLLSKLHNYG
jgi:hypothetical protein